MVCLIEWKVNCCLYLQSEYPEVKPNEKRYLCSGGESGFSLNNIYSEKHNNNDIFPVQKYILRIQILG